MHAADTEGSTPVVPEDQVVASAVASCQDISRRWRTCQEDGR